MTTDMEQAQSTVEQARSRAERIRAGLDSLHLTQMDIADAYRARDWTTLGYDTWESYVGAEFVGAKLRVPREERRELVSTLRTAGMSTRAIAAATGVSAGTVNSDARSTVQNRTVDDTPATVTGVNGKTYAASKPAASGPEPLDAEIVDDDSPTPKPAPKPRIDVVNKINRVLTRANQAADAADEITKNHLVNRTGEAALWERNLARHLESLNRLHAALTEVQA